MRINLDITFQLWRELGLSYIPPSDSEAQVVFLDMGLRWVSKNMKMDDLSCTYDVVDKDKFFLAVIKHGLQFKEIWEFELKVGV